MLISIRKNNKPNTLISVTRRNGIKLEKSLIRTLDG